MDSIFRSLARFCGFEREPLHEPLIGLNKEQITRLKQLRDSPEWLVYLDTLDKVINLYGETLLQARDDSQLHETRGAILGMRRAAHLIDELLIKEKQLAGTAERRESVAKLGDDRRRVALYGSPAFSRAANK